MGPAQCRSSRNEETKDCQVVIIGGGSAAFAAAAAAAPLAASVKIVNEGLPMGGCCVNVGCVPSKFLIQASHICSPHNSTPPFRGFSQASDRVANFGSLTDQNRRLVESLRDEKYGHVISQYSNVEYVKGYGRILDKDDHFVVAVRSSHTDQIPLREIPADRVIIATGVHNSIPEHLRHDLSQIPYLTNESAYFEPVCPESLIILGGGYVAIEAAQMFSRLGSRVTLLQRSSHILSDLTEDISSALAGYLQDEGIELQVRHKILSVATDSDNQVTVTAMKNGSTCSYRATKIFIATGRSANTASVSGIPITTSTSRHGGFIVSDTLQTSIPGVYAAGDCVADSPQYVYTAAAEGKLAALNALASFNGQEGVQMDYTVVPWVVFSSPAVAGVGLDIASARAHGIDAEASTVLLSQLPRALVQQDTRGFVTLIRNRQDDTIIGARILAEEGGELVMEASLCISCKVKTQEVASMFHPYLTWNEAWKLAALGFNKDVKSLSCCAT